MGMDWYIVWLFFFNDVWDFWNYSLSPFLNFQFSESFHDECLAASDCIDMAMIEDEEVKQLKEKLIENNNEKTKAEEEAEKKLKELEEQREKDRQENLNKIENMRTNLEKEQAKVETHIGTIAEMDKQIE
eukprot:gene17223-5337_t